jgi:alkaline phosphatase
MIRPFFHALLASALLLFAVLSVADNKPTRNVILIIGDGMDEQQITIARNYLAGSSGQLLLDTMPLRAQVQVLAIEDQVDGKPVYVSDSANTATAMATGVVTSRGRIATAAGTNTPLMTLVELTSLRGPGYHGRCFYLRLRNRRLFGGT